MAVPFRPALISIALFMISPAAFADDSAKGAPPADDSSKSAPPSEDSTATPPSDGASDDGFVSVDDSEGDENHDDSKTVPASRTRSLTGVHAGLEGSATRLRLQTPTGFGYGSGYSLATNKGTFGGGVGAEHRSLSVSPHESGAFSTIEQRRISGTLSVRGSRSHSTNPDPTGLYGGGGSVSDSYVDLNVSGEYGYGITFNPTTPLFVMGRGTGELNLSSESVPRPGHVITGQGELQGGLHLAWQSADLLVGPTLGLRLGDTGDTNDVTGVVGLRGDLVGDRGRLTLTGQHSFGGAGTTRGLRLDGDVNLTDHVALGAYVAVTDRTRPAFSADPDPVYAPYIGSGSGLVSGSTRDTEVSGGARAIYRF